MEWLEAPTVMLESPSQCRAVSVPLALSIQQPYKAPLHRHPAGSPTVLQHGLYWMAMVLLPAGAAAVYGSVMRTSC